MTIISTPTRGECKAREGAGNTGSPSALPLRSARREPEGWRFMRHLTTGLISVWVA